MGNCVCVNISIFLSLSFKVFTANDDGDTPAENSFEDPIQVVGIRIYPDKPEGGEIALRVELEGCKHECKYTGSVFVPQT